MKRELYVSEEIMMFILDKREKPLKGGSDYYQTVSVIAGIFYELLEEEYITLNEKKMIQVNSDKQVPIVNYQLFVYEIIKESSKSKKMSSWFSKMINKNEIYQLITDNLLELGCIEEREKSILIFTQKQIVVNEKIIDSLVQEIRAEFLENGSLSDDVAFLTYILNLNNILRNFFSKYENDQLKTRLKEIKNEPIGLIAKSVIDSISSGISAGVIAASVNS